MGLLRFFKKPAKKGGQAYYDGGHYDEPRLSSQGGYGRGDYDTEPHPHLSSTSHPSSAHHAHPQQPHPHYMERQQQRPAAPSHEPRAMMGADDQGRSDPSFYGPQRESDQRSSAFLQAPAPHPHYQQHQQHTQSSHQQAQPQQNLFAESLAQQRMSDYRMSDHRVSERAQPRVQEPLFAGSHHPSQDMSPQGHPAFFNASAANHPGSYANNLDLKDLRFWDPHSPPEERYPGEEESDESESPPLRFILTLGILIIFAALAWLVFRWSTQTVSTTIPHIQADPQPFKVRPDQPGGVIFPHQDKLVYGRLGNEGNMNDNAPVERLLPPPEQPMQQQPVYPQQPQPYQGQYDQSQGHYPPQGAQQGGYAQSNYPAQPPQQPYPPQYQPAQGDYPQGNSGQGPQQPLMEGANAYPPQQQPLTDRQQQGPQGYVYQGPQNPQNQYPQEPYHQGQQGDYPQQPYPQPQGPQGGAGAPPHAQPQYSPDALGDEEGYYPDNQEMPVSDQPMQGNLTGANPSLSQAPSYSQQQQAPLRQGQQKYHSQLPQSQSQSFPSASSAPRQDPRQEMVSHGSNDLPTGFLPGSVPASSAQSQGISKNNVMGMPQFYEVKLGSLETKPAAEREFDRLKAKYKDSFKNLNKAIVKETTNGKAFFVVYALGLQGEEAAKTFCKTLGVGSYHKQ